MKEVVIYGRSEPPCPYCEQAKSFLNNKDVDNDPTLTAKRGIRGLPTLVARRSDEVIGIISGNKSKDEVAEWMVGL